MIQIYYGYGKGKTTSAIGAGVRSHGAGLKTALVQFFKDNKSSELAAVPFEVYKAPDSLPFNPGPEYGEWVGAALDFVRSSDCDVLILDEFLDLIPDFLSAEDALKIFDSSKEYIVTGHKKEDSLFEAADYITEFKKEKHPYDKGVQARLGIEY